MIRPSLTNLLFFSLQLVVEVLKNQQLSLFDVKQFHLHNFFFHRKAQQHLPNQPNYSMMTLEPRDDFGAKSPFSR